MGLLDDFSSWFKRLFMAGSPALPTNMSDLTAPSVTIKLISNVIPQFVDIKPTYQEPVLNVEHDPVCPYCSYRFDSWPSRNRKCPGCNNRVIIRTLQTGRMIVTKDQAAIIDSERKANAYRNKIMNLVFMAQISIEDFYVAKSTYERKTGSVWAERDVAWQIICETATKRNSKRDYDGARVAWNAACWFKNLHAEDPSQEVLRRELSQLRGLKKSGYTTVRIWTECRCPACFGVNNQIQSVDEALARPLLPVKECQTGRTILCGYRGDVTDIDVQS
jgi:hypothetical protein